MMDVDVVCVWILVVKFFCILFSVEMCTSLAARTCRGILPPEVFTSTQTQSLSIFGGEGAGRAGRWNGVGDMYYSTHRLESKLIVTGNKLITVGLVWICYVSVWPC